MLANLKLSTKLALLVGAFVIAFGSFAWVAFDTIAKVRVGGPEYARIVEGKDIVADVLPPPEYIIESYLVVLQAVDEADPAAVAHLVERGKKLREEYDVRHDFWVQTLEAGPLREALVTDSYEPARSFFDVRDRELVPALQSGNKARALELARGPLRQHYDQHRKHVERVVEMANARNLATEKSSAELLERTAMVMRGLAFGVCVLLVAFAFMTRDMGKSLTRRIGSVATAAERVAEGDLTVTLDGGGADEMGQMVGAVRKMTDGLASLVSRVKKASIELLSTATEIAAASKQQDATMTGLGASTSEVASAVREISATSTELLRTMDELSSMARGATSGAEEGRVALEEMEATMRTLSEATGSISAKLGTIHERAADINGVVATITKVADQTNLLSVNAAIEAEKAGEYGRGFLVLAREIRRLADQTAVSTLDIERIVRTMQAAVTAGVMEMDRFSDEMRRGRERVSQVGGKIVEVIQQVQGVLGRFDQVNVGMKNQADGARQINSSMSQLHESARQISASLKEFNVATSSMRDAVGGLRSEIARYKVAE